VSCRRRPASSTAPSPPPSSNTDHAGLPAVDPIRHIAGWSSAARPPAKNREHPVPAPYTVTVIRMQRQRIAGGVRSQPIHLTGDGVSTPNPR